MSWTGLCTDCAKENVHENVEGLMLKQGQPLRRWRLGMARSVGAVLLDDTAQRIQTDGRDA